MGWEGRPAAVSQIRAVTVLTRIVVAQGFETLLRPKPLPWCLEGVSTPPAKILVDEDLASIDVAGQLQGAGDVAGMMPATRPKAVSFAASSASSAESAIWMASTRAEYLLLHQRVLWVEIGEQRRFVEPAAQPLISMGCPPVMS